VNPTKGVTRGHRVQASVTEVDDELPKIGAPATRALAGIGVTRLSQLADYTENDLLTLHGFGPRALTILRQALAARGLSFRPPG
jgi:hypothetical protein